MVVFCETPRRPNTNPSFIRPARVGSLNHSAFAGWQNDWLDANYHLVVEICEQRYLYPIIGYTPIIAKQSVSKKSQVIDLFGEVSAGMSVEYKALVLGTLHDMWPTIKRFTPEKILEIVFESVNTTSKVSTAILKDVLKKLKGDEYKSLQY